MALQYSGDVQRGDTTSRRTDGSSHPTSIGRTCHLFHRVWKRSQKQVAKCVWPCKCLGDVTGKWWIIVAANRDRSSGQHDRLVAQKRSTSKRHHHNSCVVSHQANVHLHRALNSFITQAEQVFSQSQFQVKPQCKSQWLALSVSTQLNIREFVKISVIASIC